MTSSFLPLASGVLCSTFKAASDLSSCTTGALRQKTLRETFYHSKCADLMAQKVTPTELPDDAINYCPCLHDTSVSLSQVYVLYERCEEAPEEMLHADMIDCILDIAAL